MIVRREPVGHRRPIGGGKGVMGRAVSLRPQPQPPAKTFSSLPLPLLLTLSSPPSSRPPFFHSSPPRDPQFIPIHITVVACSSPGLGRPTRTVLVIVIVRWLVLLSPRTVVVVVVVVVIDGHRSSFIVSVTSQARTWAAHKGFGHSSTTTGPPIASSTVVRSISSLDIDRLAPVSDRHRRSSIGPQVRHHRPPESTL